MSLLETADDQQLPNAHFSILAIRAQTCSSPTRQAQFQSQLLVKRLAPWERVCNKALAA